MRASVLRAIFTTMMLTGLLVATAAGQNAQGTILGHIQDASGAALPGVTVTAKNVNTGISAQFTTTSSGDYVFVNLIPGSYAVTAARSGFQSAASQGLTLEVGQTLRQDFALQLGAVSQQVTVAADSQMVQTDNASIGQVITTRQIQALPLSGRDFTNLISINAGVTTAAGGIQATVFDQHGLNTQFQEMSIDGSRPASISYVVDGITDTDFFFSKPINIPPADTIQEFKLENGVYPASGGFGSAQVDVALKSGTNQLHGEASDFLENSAFQPQNPINAYLNTAKGTKLSTNPPFRQNQFGANLGGPLTLPFGLYSGHDRSFFFASYEGGRIRRTSAASLLQVPTAAERQGDFSDWPFPIYDPSTTGSQPVTAADPSGRAQFAGNKIGSINPIAQKMLNYFPMPNITCTMPCGNYVATTENPTDTDVWTGRLDHSLSNRDQLSLTLNTGRIHSPSISPLPASSSDVTDHSYLLGVQWQRTFTPNLIGVVRAGYTRENFHEGASTAFGPNLSAQLGLANTNPVPAFYGLPSLAVGDGYSGPGNSNNGYSQKDNVFQYAGNVTYVHGAHTMAFGADIRRIQLVDADGFTVNGQLNFTGAYTASDPTAGSAGKLGPTAGNGFADLLLGDPLSLKAPVPLASDLYNVRATAWGFYFQDDYHLSPRLTLNLGMRYEVPSTLHAVDNSGSVLTLGTPGGGLIYADQKFVSTYTGSAGSAASTYLQCCVSNKLVPGVKNNFQPRIGFAWRPLASNRFVIRGGYGIFGGVYMRFYDGTNYDENALSTLSRPAYPAASGSEKTSPLALNGLWLAPFNTFSAFPPAWQYTVQTEWPKNRNPYTEQWTLDTQYALTPSMLLDLGYVGSHDMHLPLQYEFNDARLPTTPDIIIGPNGAPVICNSLRDASQATGNFANCPATGAAFQPIDTRVPLKNFGAGSYANANVLSANYNALQVRLNQRFNNGLTLLANYTWSRALDELSEIATFSASNNFIQDAYNIRGNYGPADFNQSHRVSLSYLYDLPVGKGKRWSLGPANWVLGGWQTSGVVTLASGLPFSVYCCSRGGGRLVDLSGDPFGDRLRAQVAGNLTAGSPGVTQWFNTAAFTQPATGTIGNSGRNILTAPMTRQANLSFLKNLPIGERQNIQYRLDVFNFLSSWHTGTRFPDNRVSDGPSFGSLIGSPTGVTYGLGQENLWTPRVIQMALTYSF